MAAMTSDQISMVQNDLNKSLQKKTNVMVKDSVLQVIQLHFFIIIDYVNSDAIAMHHDVLCVGL